MTALKKKQFLNLACWLWRLPLGLVFVYAAAEKIYDPAGFALTIDNYRLFPVLLIGPIAIWLPWLEMLAGLLVLGGGRWERPAALILGVLLLSFMAAVGYNLYRGLDFECGCFGSGSRRAGFNLLWQDALLLICSMALIFRVPKGGHLQGDNYG